MGQICVQILFQLKPSNSLLQDVRSKLMKVDWQDVVLIGLKPYPGFACCQPKGIFFLS